MKTLIRLTVIITLWVGAAMAQCLGGTVIPNPFGNIPRMLCTAGPGAASLNSVVYASQQIGADCGAKINAADTALGSTAGEIWVDQACGTTWTTAVSTSSNHILRFIQGGTYTSSAGLTVHNLESPGGISSYLAPTEYVLLVQANGANLTNFFTVPGYPGRIHGLSVNCNGSNNTSSAACVKFVDCYRCELLDSWVWGSHGDGVLWTSSTHTGNLGAVGKIWNLKSENHGGAALHVVDATDLFVSDSELVAGVNSVLCSDCGGLRLTHTDVSNSSGDAVKITGTSTGLSSAYVQIENNHWGNATNGHGINVDGNSTDVSGTEVAVNGIITGNESNLSTALTNNTYDWLRIKDTSGWVVANNIMSSFPSHTFKYGIEEIDSGVMLAGTNTFVDNIFTGTFGTGTIINVGQSSGGVGTTNIQTFTSSGTWTRPIGARQVEVILIGGGGGGGSGRKGAAASVRCGGGGGSGAGIARYTFPAALLTSSVTVTVGTGGPGGAAQATADTNGNNGTAGGGSSFGSYLIAASGQPGNGGSNAAGAGGGSTVDYPNAGILGASDGEGGSADTSGGVGNGGNHSQMKGSGAGAGGGISSGNTANTGGAGGFSALGALTGTYSGSNNLLSQGSAGAVNTVGGAGGNASANSPFGGNGGGGGGASTTGNAGGGGNGGTYGAGGGGGGAAVDAVGNSGAGGTGGNGIAIVITYF